MTATAIHLTIWALFSLGCVAFLGHLVFTAEKPTKIEMMAYLYILVGLFAVVILGPLLIMG